MTDLNKNDLNQVKLWLGEDADPNSREAKNLLTLLRLCKETEDHDLQDLLVMAALTLAKKWRIKELKNETGPS